MTEYEAKVIYMMFYPPKVVAIYIYLYLLIIIFLGFYEGLNLGLTMVKCVF